jgi:hypothetical protein
MSPRKKSVAERVKSSLYLSKPLHAQLVRIADETGVSANDVIILALRQFFLADKPVAAQHSMPLPSDDFAGFD